MENLLATFRKKFLQKTSKDVTEDLSISILSLIKWIDFLMFIDLPFIFAFVKTKNDYVNLRKRLIDFSFIFVLSIIMICFQFNQLVNSKIIGNILLQPMTMSPLGYHMFDIYRFIYERTDSLDNEKINRIDEWLKINAQYQLEDLDYADLSGIIKDKNLIVIQFESLENILINASYNGQEIIPNINKLLKNSIYFNNIYEQVGDGNSSDAELMFNTSIYPISNGSTFLRFGNNSYISLPILLDNQGYISEAIHGDNKEFWNRYKAFPAIGFDKYIAEDEFNDKISGGMGILDESLFKQSLLEIENLKSPYYLFIITLTSHMPFNTAERVGKLELPNDDITSKYLQTINYTDKVFGEFYNQLEKKGLLKNTVLIIYGDHEGIHKYYSTDLPNNDKKIPFIIYMPGMKGIIIDKTGGQVDMMPTLAYLLGIDRETYACSIMGRNLFGKDPGVVIFHNGLIRGQIDNEQHLKETQNIANDIITGNYFGLPKD